MNIVIRKDKYGWRAFWYVGDSHISWIQGVDPTREQLIENIERYWT